MSNFLSPERRVQIERVLIKARALPVDERDAFLERECGADAALRREVAALLDDAGTAATSPERLSLDAAARMIEQAVAGTTRGAAGAPDPWIGQTVSHFEIQERLGSGGMGVVYRARDSKLGRTVALKFLPWSLCGDSEAKARFIHEAQAASALEHNNITTIFEIGETFDGQLFIAMAFLSGETLREMIARGPLPLDQALECASQLADGLSKAHAVGIVHRDVKPANVMLTADGVVKLLDFGIAKLAGGTSVTRSGTAVGTPAYMSPEQARGEPVDHRTDIWSLGVVFYEMLTGQRPFQGETAQSVVQGILEREPTAPKRLKADLPAEVTTILHGCLAKDPEHRYQTAEDVLADVQHLREGRAPAKRRAGNVWSGLVGEHRTVLAVATIILTLAIAAVVVIRPAGIPVLSNPRQVSGSTALEDYPAISPDGRTVAYESNEAGRWDIWVSQPGAEAPVNRTAAFPGNNRYPSWSPDGRTIAFWSDRDGGCYLLMPAFGGSAQPLASTSNSVMNYFSPAAWSADGKTLAVVLSQFDAEPVIALVDLATRETRKLALPGIEETRLDPAWSPDGSMIAYVDAAQQIAEATTLRVLHIASGRTVAITNGRFNARNPVWRPDSRTLMFISNESGPSDLWMCRLTAAGALADSPRQITTALDVRHASFSGDIATMAFAKGRWVANLWRVPVRHDRPATWAEAKAITSEYAFIEFLSLSPDGKRLAFSSDRRGSQDIWTMSTDGADITRLTSDPAQEWGPDWSPDGSRIAFYSNRTGDREIWVMSANGGPATQITHSPGLDATPRWSPDGRRLIWNSDRDGNTNVWSGEVDGSGERMITDGPGAEFGAVFSPEGDWIYYSSQRSGRNQLLRIPAAGGKPEPVGKPGVCGSMCWSPDGKFLYIVNKLDGPGNIWAFSRDDQRTYPITDLSGRPGELSGAAPATDGKSIYFSWREDLGDIWVMDVSHS